MSTRVPSVHSTNANAAGPDGSHPTPLPAPADIVNTIPPRRWQPRFRMGRPRGCRRRAAWWSVRRSDHPCPLCSAPLVPTGKAYPLDELLAGWHPAEFSRETLDDLRNQADHTRLYECAACGLGIFHPQIIGNSAFYGEIESAFSGGWYQDWKWEFGEAIADAESCRNILDVGCGTGGFLAKAKERVQDVAGVDFNESALSVARGKGIRTFRSLDEIPVSESRFDAVFTFHVLEHVPDPVDFLRRLAGFLAPSGKIGMSVPNMDGPVRYIDPCYMNMPPHHATRWTSKALRSLAGQVGLAVERTAVEPLAYRDVDYYVTHWVNTVASGSPVARKLLRWGCKVYFRALFGFLSLMGRNVTALYRGQSVYVLMRKGGDARTTG